MRERVLGTLRRIYGPPYRGLPLFVAAWLVLATLNRVPWLIEFSRHEDPIENVLPGFLEFWWRQLERLVADPRQVFWGVPNVLLRSFASLPVLLPVSVAVGLRFVWRGSVPAVRVWGAMWAAAGAFGIAWLAIVLGGGRPGNLPVFIEPVLWSCGLALGGLLLMALVRPGPPVPLSTARLPALTLLALVMGHPYVLSAGAVGISLFHLDVEQFQVYMVSSPAAKGSAAGSDVFPWTLALISFPAAFVFLAVALRGLTVGATIRDLFAGLRRSRRVSFAVLVALVSFALLLRVAPDVQWWIYQQGADSRLGRILRGLAFEWSAAALRALFLYFMARTVWSLTARE